LRLSLFLADERSSRSSCIIALYASRREENHRQVAGLILPQLATKDDWFGEVVAVGPEVKSVKPGDIVVAPAYTAVEFTSFDRGETYRAYHEDNILAVFDREEILGG